MLLNKENKWKYYFYGLAICAILALWFSIDGCNSNKSRSKYFFDRFLKDSTELVEKKNQLGQITVTSEALELTKKELEQYVKENEELKKKLANKYSNIQTIYRTITKIRIDSIPILVHDTIPCGDFELSQSVTKPYYTLDFFLKNVKGFPPHIGIFNLTIPDTTTMVIGTKKSGFLGLKRTIVAEEVHSNPFVKVTSANTIVKKDAKPRTLRKVAVGIGIGIVGGFLLFNK